MESRKEGIGSGEEGMERREWRAGRREGKKREWEEAGGELTLAGKTDCKSQEGGVAGKT